MWKTVKLGDVAKATGGSGFPKKYQGKTAGHYPFFKVSDMNTEGNEVFMKKAANYVSFAELRRMKAKHHPAGTIVFPKIGGAISTNKKRILTCDAAFDNNVMGVIPKYDISPEYLHKIFLGFNLYELSNKAALPSITNSTVDELEITLPPLPVQEQIVEKLDVAFAGIDKAINATEKNIENAEALFYSTCKKVINSIQSDKSSLGSFAEISSGGTPSKKTKEFWDGNIAWFSSGELNDLYTKDPDDRITEEGLGKSNAKLFPKGSLLIGMYDTAALKMSILDREGTFNQAICGLKPNNRVDMQYIYYALNVVKPEVLKLRSGVRQQNLNQSKIKNIEIIFPELVIQKEISYKLNKIFQKQDKLIEIYEQKLSHLISLKSSIFNQAFSGELTKDTA